MNDRLIEIAYGALLHDIGKIYQRIYSKSNLTEQELDTTPFNQYLGYHTHLHSGYTSRFFQKYLKQYNAFERVVSEHHKEDDDVFSKVIKRADRLASAIDRQDELHDNEIEITQGRYRFITSRLSSVMSEVDFGKAKETLTFPLSSLRDLEYPIKDFKPKSVEESAQEYQVLFSKLVSEIENHPVLTKSKIDIESYHTMYHLLNQYLVTVPASTYEGSQSSVSLFDHLKLTSAIASCLYFEECFKSQKFYMLELDVSGIQRFIYQVTEGSEGKKGLTKALRGRSAFVGLLTNAIAYAFLKIYGLTESNILFNTGGGALILLPSLSTTEQDIHQKAQELQKCLFELFKTDITFVYGLLEISADELEAYQSDKALELKQIVGRNKMKKFSSMITKDFFFEKIEHNDTCVMCGRPVKHQHQLCDLCEDISKISQIYTKEDQFGILYDFNHQYQDIECLDQIDLNFVTLIFIQKKIELKEGTYIDSMNDFGVGNHRSIANLVPKRKDIILNFEEICTDLLDHGDPKLGILKMDVDNLGAIFAFGLKQEGDVRVKRSISKYVTLSRLIEHFFGNRLVKICQSLSSELNPDITHVVSNETMFYINYAGGDDLVIMGPAYGILYLADKINACFERYTGNQNITISGGIQIQSFKSPVRFGVQEAEEQLSLSKQGDKHQLSLMGVTLRFDRYHALLKRVEDYCEWIQTEQVSRTMIYHIMLNLRDCSFESFIYLVPKIQYILFRNLSHDSKLLERLRHDLMIEDESSLKEYVLALKLVIMFTRKNKGEKNDEL